MGNTMTDHIVTRSLLATLIVTLNVCALTVGAAAGITWWATTMLAIYPFAHLTFRYLDNRYR